MNSLAELSRLQINPTPPFLVCDMAGSVLDAIVADLLQDGDQALLMRTEFVTEGLDIQTHLAVLPRGSALQTLLRHLDLACSDRRNERRAE